MNIVATIGHFTIGSIQKIGHMAIFVSSIVQALVSGRIYFKAILRQFFEIGYLSLPVVGLTAIFTGAVLALQSYTGFSRFNAESAIASVVVLSITRELGPVLAGLMLAGRVGAAIAAELGTMKVTEQIDALYTLGANPFKFLVVPRVIAGILMMPLLVIVADIIGVFGGYLVSVYKLGFSPFLYLKNTALYLKAGDITSGLIKAAFFGFIVTTMGCYHGYGSQGGARGVGNATTKAVVSSSILILLSNYVITGIMFAK